CVVQVLFLFQNPFCVRDHVCSCPLCGLNVKTIDRNGFVYVGLTSLSHEQAAPNPSKSNGMCSLDCATGIPRNNCSSENNNSGISPGPRCLRFAESMQTGKEPGKVSLRLAFARP